MSLPKFLFLFALILFGLIGGMALWKGKPSKSSNSPSSNPSLSYDLPESKHVSRHISSSTTTNHIAPPLHIALNDLSETEGKEGPASVKAPKAPAQIQTAQPMSSVQSSQLPLPTQSASTLAERPVPEADNMYRFFILDAKQFPIVETVAYKSQVPWVMGRPAWVADYASHFHTSRHFIARSLNGKADYLTQNVVEGNRFNVLKSNTNIAFYLVVDLFRCKMWFYYVDLDAKEKVLVKSYSVGLGRWDASTGSGLLTPLGAYQLGSRTGVYTPKSKDIYKGQETAMIGVFGTRWIPFEQEIAGCTAPAKGLGIHGCPWVVHPTTNQLVEDTSGINHHTSDGCIRLATADVEELYAVIVSRPTTVLLVADFFDAEVPGIERASFALPSAPYGKE